MSRCTQLSTVSALLLAASVAHAQAPAASPAPEVGGAFAFPPAPAANVGGSQYYKIGVQHYDAGVMADLITRQDAIVLVPPNFVIPSGGPAGGGFAAGPLVTTVGGPAARALPGTPGLAAPAGAVPNNRLPDGVQRIYALESDNSLVIQTVPGFQPSQPTTQEGNPNDSQQQNF